MQDRSESELKKLLQDVDFLIHSVEENVGKSVFSHETPPLSPDQLRQNLSAQDGSLEPCNDGRLEIFVAEDGMKVSGDFFPPTGGGEFLTYEAIETVLLGKGIVWGVNWPYIKDALTQCNLDQKIVHDVPVATGLSPVDEVPERWQLVEVLQQKRQAIDASLLSLDFKSLSPFLKVEKDEVLAEILPFVEGVPGFDVFGHEISFSVKKIDQLLPGKNVERRDGQGFVALCSGFLKVEKGFFLVEEVLFLENGVNYSTGHIHFTGDVVIAGEVKPGFQIHTKGSITSNQTMDVTEVFCEGDIFTPGGLIGAVDGAFVRTEGLVKAKFIENLSLLAKKSVIVHSSIHHSQVKTLDSVTLGDKGILLGAKLIAQNGVEVFQVGHENGARSEIITGIDFTALDKLTWAREQIVGLGGQYRQLEAQLKENPIQPAAVMEAMAKIRTQVAKLNEVCRIVVGTIDKNEDAQVRVKGTIFPGNSIEICHVTLVVPKAYSKVVFSLDKKRGQISVSSL